MKRLFTILLAVLSLLSLTACGGSPTEETSQEPLVDIQPQEPEAPPEPTPEELAAQEVEDLLASLTLEEKVGQLFFVRVPDTDAVSDVSTYHLGGYILFGRDTADKTADALIQTIQSYQDAAAVDTGIPLLIGVDEEGGTVVRVAPIPICGPPSSPLLRKLMPPAAWRPCWQIPERRTSFSPPWAST